MYKTLIFDSKEYMEAVINSTKDYKVIAIDTIDGKYHVTVYRITDSNSDLLEQNF